MRLAKNCKHFRTESMIRRRGRICELVSGVKEGFKFNYKVQKEGGSLTRRLGSVPKVGSIEGYGLTTCLLFSCLGYHATHHGRVLHIQNPIY